LSACSGPSDPPPPSHAAHSSTPQASTAATASQTPTPTATPTPVTLTCDDLLSRQQLYDFNPNFGDDPGYKAADGTLSAKVVQEAGISCGWLNQTSKSVLEVAVATPTKDQLTQAMNAAVKDSNVVPTYGVPPQVTGYFTAASGSGIAEAFTGAWWVVVTSKDFLEPGDAQPVMAAVLQNLAKH